MKGRDASYTPSLRELDDSEFESLLASRGADKACASIASSWMRKQWAASLEAALGPDSSSEFSEALGPRGKLKGLLSAAEEVEAKTVKPAPLLVAIHKRCAATFLRTPSGTAGLEATNAGSSEEGGTSREASLDRAPRRASGRVNPGRAFGRRYLDNPVTTRGSDARAKKSNQKIPQGVGRSRRNK